MFDSKEMRGIYVEELINVAKEDKSIVMIEADLANCIGSGKFKDQFPERFIDVGIAEANMVGVAAGLATCGKNVFCHSFTPFMTRRVIDQVAISVCYSDLPVKMVGSDPGIMATYNGGTHMSMEDVGLMRSIPNMAIVEPVDGVMLKALIPQIIAYDKPLYIRLQRKKAVSVFKEGETFDMYKAKTVKKGKDCTIIAAGVMVHRAITASENLAKEGFDVGVLSIHSLKPIDESAIIEVAKESGCIVTAENHSILNGLGSAVAEVLGENCPVPMKRIGVLDKFGEVGDEKYLEQLLNLTVLDIEKAVKETIQKKQR